MNLELIKISAIQALILTAAIPAFGWVMDCLIRMIYRAMSSLCGEGLTYFLFNRFTFVGVFHHELAHTLLATITGARVTRIVLFHPRGDQLGSVSYVTRGNKILTAIQHTFTAIAPIFCGGITTFLLYTLLRSWSGPVWAYALILYLMISILMHMTMSSQDIRVMWKGIPVVYVIVWILLLGYHAIFASFLS